ncbi:hypothetical protein BTS2_1426 [Bacillus sp. TS-2]|nr:hypothetical protein BTS2_1426 [Bacillus sp. TS-2]
MSMKTTSNRKSLLRSWTKNYVITLVIGLLVITVLSVIWIRHTTLEHRLNMTTLLGEEIASRFVEITGGEPRTRGDVHGFVSERNQLIDLDSDPSIYIVNPDGAIISINEQNDRLFSFQIPIELLYAEEPIQKINVTNPIRASYYMVKTPIQWQEHIIGWVVLVESEEILTKLNQEYQLLFIFVISLGLLGWAAIYFLSKRFLKPIEQVAYAAKQVEQGYFNVHIPDAPKEKELHELVDSFEKMTKRLHQLETLRTELLAGVTHELKTPVTSISGLLQAVKDGVVEEEEAREFIESSLKETDRLHKMVDDLLAFNSFTVNQFPIQKEPIEINSLLSEQVNLWKMTQAPGVDCVVQNLNRPFTMYADPARIKQILINLLNNAYHSMNKEYQQIYVYLTLNEKENVLLIDVKDNGSGIAPSEQDYIFERFFRGESKKYKIRGLGLGLPFSKMIAQAMEGDLQLKETSSEGTTFTVIIPVSRRLEERRELDE